MRNRPLIDQAFSLVEVTVALGVAAFCLVTIFGLMPLALRTNQTATSESASIDVLSSIVADLRATRANAAASPQYAIDVTAATQTLYFDAGGKPVPVNDARYRVTITFPANSAGAAAARFATLKMSWPAAANPSTTQVGSVETFAAVDRRP